MLFKILALLVLLIFYSIYLTKQFLLKSKGIIVVQMGKVNKKKENKIETLMGIATVGMIFAQVLSIIFEFNHAPENIRYIGFIIALIGDMIFLLSVICMKDSWRVGIPENSKTKLVTTGIYSISRNPAFLGFYLQYIGVMMIYFNLLTVMFTIFAIYMLHLQILQEEEYLKIEFKDEYLEYQNKVNRYLGIKNK